MRNICAVQTPMPFTCVSFGSEITQIGGLLLRQSHTAKLLLAQFQNPFRSERLSRERRETLEDGHRRLAIQLLINDGLGQTVKLRIAVFHAAGTDALDDGTHQGIGLTEM